ncbi:50S ribosomal protein L33 [Mycoplasmopsis bovigenitalium]|uniref:Large ribosomal subunit protein bL33 n=1 Tax=Mycoplasmopsis bovigenitalium 51080 TaxID=1188235 RepID=N9TTC9_9BACT|nr:50S ribosomal protein L33 [Mycoplasmopsis bovigenitalium]ENY69404.1 50S ribosomal protein L33 [Mycoplasmopsis bovigenitalium 51080]
MKKTKVLLSCSECFAMNYATNKGAGNLSRIEIKKYCPKCRKHAIHKEEK